MLTTCTLALLPCFSPYLLQSWFGKRRVVPCFVIKTEAYGCYICNSLRLSFLPLVVVLKEKWAMKAFPWAMKQHFHVDKESSSGTVFKGYLVARVSMLLLNAADTLV